MGAVAQQLLGVLQIQAVGAVVVEQGFDHVAIMGRITGSEADAYADNVAGNDPAPGTIVYTGDLEHGFTSARLSEVFGLKLEVTHANGRWNAYAL